jgi:hypothetical protein
MDNAKGWILTWIWRHGQGMGIDKDWVDAIETDKRSDE